MHDDELKKPTRRSHKPTTNNSKISTFLSREILSAFLFSGRRIQNYKIIFSSLTTAAASVQ